MTDKQIIIDDQKKTIHRLQDECTEKTNAIIALGEQLKRKEQECEKAKLLVLQAVKDFSLEYGTPYYDRLLNGAKSLGIEVKDYE